MGKKRSDLKASRVVVAHVFNTSIGRQRQADLHDFKTSQFYRMSARTGSKATQRNSVSKIKQNKTNKQTNKKSDKEEKVYLHLDWK